MAGNARMTTDKPPKKPVYFEDPDQPGKSRHVQCFRKAGIDAKRLRYPTTTGPCWVCEPTAGHKAIYQGYLAALEENRELATLLDTASEAAFALAKETCSVWGLRIIQRTELEREHAQTLAAFRRAWSLARAAALLPAKSGQAGGENESRWRRVPILDPPADIQEALRTMPTADADPKRPIRCFGCHRSSPILDPPADADPKQTWLFNIGPTLDSDPTLGELVKIDDLHASAGSMAAAGRLFREDADRGVQQLRENKGKDPFDLAVNMTSGKVSAEWLARVMHGVEHPLAELPRKPVRKSSDTDEEWDEKKKEWDEKKKERDEKEPEWKRLAKVAKADADTLRQRMSRTRKTARSKSRARRKNTVE